MTAARRSAGFTLIEMMIALVISSVIMGAVYKLLSGNQRFYRAQTQVTEVQQNLRAVGLILPGELREISASAGDIIAMSDTSITIRAMRIFSMICAVPDPATGVIVLRNALTFGYRAVDNTRDSIIVFRDGNPGVASDDRWVQSAIASTGSGTCSDGAAGLQLTLTGMTGGISQLDSVSEGSPIRTFERVRYRLYDDGTGTWWLGIQSFVSGAFGAVSPVAGPLKPVTGIAFRYYTSAGAVTATPANVAFIEIVARGKSSQEINTSGRQAGYYEDSLVVRVALRNN